LFFRKILPNAGYFWKWDFIWLLGVIFGYPNSHLQEVIKGIPEKQITGRNGCPYLPPQKYRGKEMSRPI